MAGHSYFVVVDESMQQLQVTAHFAAPVHAISARAADAGRYVRAIADCDSGRSLTTRGRRVRLPDAGIRCLEYRVDLARAARHERRNRTLSDANVIVSPASWLWRPPIDADTPVTVRFDVPDSMHVFVPWQRLPGSEHAYRVLASPQTWTAPAVFGDFVYREVAIPGATLRVSVLRSDGDIDSDELIDWVRDTASNVTLAYGQFPNPSPSVVILPVGSGRRSASPVPFGRVIRDGGETVELLVNEGMPIDAFYDDWTATHEFSHLMLPYVSSRHRWISEGFAQYYQNLLLARGGQYDERRAWQKLVEGFERGRRSSPGLSPNQAASRGGRGSTMKIYWSGAAIALLADVELRRRSDGAESLDTVLAELKRCCLPADSAWNGQRLFAQLDAFAGEPVFMPLYRRHANTAGFPSLAATLAQLGVELDDGRVSLNDSAPLAALRRAMTVPSTETL
ncbi:MAG: hypothetical protein R3288_00825 [Woeseiaceae bacterium]|nr:hypothetical protein [Woeseiaceae bacterium]